MKEIIERIRGEEEINESGFSLIELVVAIAVIMVLTVGGLIGYAGVVENGKKAATEAAASAVATGAAAYDADGTFPVSHAVDEWNNSAKEGGIIIVDAKVVEDLNMRCIRATATHRDGYVAVRSVGDAGCSANDGVVDPGENNGDEDFSSATDARVIGSVEFTGEFATGAHETEWSIQWCAGSNGDVLGSVSNGFNIEADVPFDLDTNVSELEENCLVIVHVWINDDFHDSVSFPGLKPTRMEGSTAIFDVGRLKFGEDGFETSDNGSDDDSTSMPGGNDCYADGIEGKNIQLTDTLQWYGVSGVSDSDTMNLNNGKLTFESEEVRELKEKIEDVVNATDTGVENAQLTGIVNELKEMNRSFNVGTSTVSIANPDVKFSINPRSSFDDVARSVSSMKLKDSNSIVSIDIDSGELVIDIAKVAKCNGSSVIIDDGKVSSAINSALGTLDRKITEAFMDSIEGVNVEIEIDASMTASNGSRTTGKIVVNSTFGQLSGVDTTAPSISTNLSNANTTSRAVEAAISTPLFNSVKDITQSRIQSDFESVVEDSLSGNDYQLSVVDRVVMALSDIINEKIG